MPDDFVDIEFSAKTVDVYYVRTAILNALQSALPHFNGRLLDIGCGKMPYRQLIKSNSLITEYTGLDIDGAIAYDAVIQPDYRWNGVTMPFDDNMFDCAMATEVFEHCPDGKLILSEVSRVLKPGGLLFFTVPFLWNLHEVPHDEYRYTPFALERLLKSTGFGNIQLSALGGWNASLGQMLGLWLKRSPMTTRRRKMLLKLLVPVVGKLLRSDIKPKTFSEGQMITGLSGIAFKK